MATMQNVHLSLPVVVAFLVSFVAQFSRLFVASKRFWGLMPVAVQAYLPPIVPALAFLGSALAGIQQMGANGTWTDLGVALIGTFALMLPGAPSNRDKEAPPKSGAPPSSRTIGLVGSCLALALGLLVLPGCASLQSVAPILAEVAEYVSDASNDLTIVEQAASQLNLSPDLRAKFDDADRRARRFLSAASKADAGAEHLTREQLDASLADFRAAWADIEQVFAAARAGKLGLGLELPTPLAVRRVSK
jgi:hypothetical protein